MNRIDSAKFKVEERSVLFFVIRHLSQKHVTKGVWNPSLTLVREMTIIRLAALTAA
jgi:hypothetical protein